MIVQGRIFTGVIRGQPLIDYYMQRLKAVLGFEPYEGTLDIRVGQSVSVRDYATKTVEHVLMDGKKMVTMWLAPVTLIFEKDNQMQRYQCWAMQHFNTVYQDNTVEIVAKDCIKDKFGLEDGAEIRIEFADLQKQEKRSVFARLKAGASDIKKSMARKKAGQERIPDSAGD